MPIYYYWPLSRLLRRKKLVPTNDISNDRISCLNSYSRCPLYSFSYPPEYHIHFTFFERKKKFLKYTEQVEYLITYTQIPNVFFFFFIHLEGVGIIILQVCRVCCACNCPLNTLEFYCVAVNSDLEIKEQTLEYQISARPKAGTDIYVSFEMCK